MPSALAVTLDGPLVALTVAIVLCGGLAWALPRSERFRGWEARLGGWRLEAVLLGCALAFGVWHGFWLLQHRNPFLVPVCGDVAEYLAYTTHFVDDRFGALSAYRYPLQPFLAAGLAHVFDLTPAVATQWLAIAAAMLLPAALYLLGRVLAPGAVSLAGALLVCALPIHVGIFARPSDYMLSSLLWVLALAAVLHALLRPGWWRMPLAGAALAGFMVATPKALTLLLLALPVLLLSSAWRHGRKVWRTGLDLLLLLVPLAVAWAVYSTIDWELRSLEHATIRVLEYAWREVGSPVSVHFFPEIIGSRSGAEGFWVVGHGDALWNLPRTIRFLLHVPRVAPEAWQGQSAFREAVLGDLGLLRDGWLLAVPLACVAPLVQRRRPWRELVHPILAGVILGACLYSQAASLSLVQPHDRYTLPLVVLLPLLMLAGGTALARLPTCRQAAERRSQLAWTPVVLVALCLLVLPSSTVGPDARRDLALHQQHADAHTARPFREVQQFADRTLDPAEQVVDLDSGGLAVAMLLGRHADLQWRPLDDRLEADGTPAPVPPAAGRRYLVDLCFGIVPSEYELLWGMISERPGDGGRLRRVSDCLIEDMRPGEVLDL